MTGIRVKTIEVPLAIYDEFCCILDAGLQYVDEMNKTNGGKREDWTDAERKCAKFIEEREWNKPKTRGGSKKYNADEDGYKGWDVDHI